MPPKTSKKDQTNTDQTKLEKLKSKLISSLQAMEDFIIKFDDSMHISQIQVRSSHLDGMLERFDDIQSDLEVLLPDDDTFLPERLQFQDKYFSVKATFEQKLESLKRANDAPSTDANQSTEQKQCSSEISADKKPEGLRFSCTTPIALPKLVIPTFKGDYIEWQSFKDLFTSVIINNTYLSESQKFYYLKSSLKGEASSLIKNILVSDCNFAVAWQTLTSRYDNKLAAINDHLRILVEMSNVSRSYTLREFTTEFKQNLDSLKNLIAIDTWDVMIIFLISKKLDPKSLEAWELSRDHGNLPTLSDFSTFLEHRAIALELVPQSTGSGTFHFQKVQKKVTHIATTNDKPYCFLCKTNTHNLYKCFKFLALTIEKRKEFLRNNHICFNCISSKHAISQCRSSFCRVCKKPHNSLIHLGSEVAEVSAPHAHKNEQTVHGNENVQSNSEEQQPRTAMLTHKGHTQVLLSTAVVSILTAEGNWVSARALLDSASEEDFITEDLLNKIGMEATAANIRVQGISGSQTNVSKSAVVTIASAVMPEFQVDLICSVLNRITIPIPHMLIDISQWPIPATIKYKLADPQFNKPASIDMLIGAKTFYGLLRNKTMHLGHNLPTITDTVFGWVLSGVTPVNSSCHTSMVCLHSQTFNLNDNISKFWRLEELSDQPVLTLEDKACEKIFVDTHERELPHGNYVVNLPLRHNALEKLGSSFHRAYKCFLSLEKRFQGNSGLFDDYKKFMDDYIEMQHAKYVPLDMESNSQYFMPHHAVLKPSSSSTPLRVVFNASSKTASGESLNDVMYTGPTLQPELYTILLRFRSYKYVFSSDISKMFRRIKVSENHQPLQRILWRDSPREPLKCVQLSTVTYGTAAAPYLATRVLAQLASDDGHMFPLAAECILNDFYMDDVLSGADDLSDVIELQKQLIQLLGKGGFELHKWASNHPEVLNKISPDKHEVKSSLELTADKSIIKTLGLCWNPTDDHFLFVVPKIDGRMQLTKRNILSCIAKLFDPIGLLGPVIIKAKIIMQKLWLEKIDWDDIVPDYLQSEWQLFASELHSLTNINVPRYYFKNTDIGRVELHGFSDASNSAYGACIYIRTIHRSGDISVCLVTTKTRVAPLKLVSIPRLELCAAVLLARLLVKVKTSLKFQIDKIFLWTDSSIVLSWLGSPATRWTVFVANRVSEIQELTLGCVWNHIRTDNNAADVLSRGINPSQLGELNLYWLGPEFLYQDESNWAKSEFGSIPIEKLPESRQPVNVLHVNRTKKASELFERFSNFGKLVRIVAWCQRFAHNTRFKENRLQGFLTFNEVSKAHDTIVTVVQREHFPNEISELETNNSLNKLRNSTILALNPYIDNSGLLRVGGRIRHSSVEFTQKHPIILPSRNHVTTLILRQYHEKMLHAGVDNTLANIRLRYWPLRGKIEIKNVIHHCITCFRFKAVSKSQLMGELPKERVTFVRPFYYVGVDFGGPINIRQARIRGSLVTKGYIALFICMSTKAVHIELVSDLSTKAFMEALKRFMSRRGKCHTIFSDNATNFKGAYNELHDLYRLFRDTDHQNSILAMTSSEGIKWKFNIPLASHMGGLWEAGIKSVKSLLRKTINSNSLTYEEMNTLLIEIEAILNSRPLCGLSDDVNDLSYISPAHFLIGDSLMSIPEINLQDIPDNRLSYWQLITKLRRRFWTVWHKQYLSSLQQRQKWRTAVPNLKLGSLVLVKEDNVNPLNWILARVTDIHLGADNLARSATISTGSGVFKRPVNKLCPLPMDRVLDEQLLIAGENVPEKAEKVVYLVGAEVTM